MTGVQKCALPIYDAAGGSTLGGTTTRTAVNGVATFNDITLDKVGNGFTLGASSTTLTAGVSSAFNITLPATKLKFTVQPTDEFVGVAISPSIKVAVQDAASQTVTTGPLASAPVTLAISNDAAGGSTLGGTKTRDAVNGVATFNDITLDKAGTGFTLGASAASLTPNVSSAFTINALPPPPATIDINVGPGVSFTSVQNGSSNSAADTLAVGGSATWHFLGGSHGVQSTGLPSFTSSGAPGSVYPNPTYVVNFPSAGIFQYDCTVHGGGMTGVIVVK